MSKITSAMAALGVVAGLGVAALPMATYAQTSGPVTVRALVNSSLAVESSVKTVDMGTVNSGIELGTQTTTIKVSGTVAKYNLGVMDNDSDTNMVWKEAGGTTQITEGTPATVIPSITAAADDLSGGWGFRIANADKTFGQWKPITAYGTADANTNLVDNKELNGDNVSGEASTDVQFGVSITGLTLQNGIYEDEVVFTATTGA